MGRDFIIYSGALEKLEKSGLIKKINELEAPIALNYPWHGEQNGDEANARQRGELSNQMAELKKSGYYAHIPGGIERLYRERLNNMYNDIEKNYWTVLNQDNGKKDIKCEYDDIKLFNAEIASRVLSPRQLWEYKWHGFSNASEFIGTVSAYIIARKYPQSNIILDNNPADSKNEAKEFESNSRGMFFSTVYPQEYKTADPFGSIVGYRPKINDDKTTFQVPHSSKPLFLVSMLKYIDQYGIKSEMFENKGEKFMQYAKSIDGQKSSNNINAMKFFDQYSADLTHVDSSNGKIWGDAVHTFPSEKEGMSYYVLSSDKRDLILSRKPLGVDPRVQTSQHVKFRQETIDDLFKKIVESSKEGYDDVTIRLLSNIVKYKFARESL